MNPRQLLIDGAMLRLGWRQVITTPGSEQPVSLPKIASGAVQSQTSARDESMVAQLPPALARRSIRLPTELTSLTSGVTVTGGDRDQGRGSCLLLFMLLVNLE